MGRLTLLGAALAASLLIGCQTTPPPAEIPAALNDDSEEARADRRRSSCAAWIEPACDDEQEPRCVLPPRPESCEEFRQDIAACVVHGGDRIAGNGACCRRTTDERTLECTPWSQKAHWWYFWGENAYLYPPQISEGSQ